jgi:hypothetical protein
MDDQLNHLATHIREHVPDQVRTGLFTSGELAQAILANPQAHIDALVEAGVLIHVKELPDPTAEWESWYQVAQPHVHRWKVTGGPYQGHGPNDQMPLELWCPCGRLTYVGNALPVEIPE